MKDNEWLVVCKKGSIFWHFVLQKVHEASQITTKKDHRKTQVVGGWNKKPLSKNPKNEQRNTWRSPSLRFFVWSAFQMSWNQCQALGPQRTVSELIPYVVQEWTMEIPEEDRDGLFFFVVFSFFLVVLFSFGSFFKSNLRVSTWACYVFSSFCQRTG